MDAHRVRFKHKPHYLDKYVRHKTPSGQDRIVKIKSLPKEEKRWHHPKHNEMYDKKIREIIYG